MVNIRWDISDQTYGLDFRNELEISHPSDLEVEKQT